MSGSNDIACIKKKLSQEVQRCFLEFLRGYRPETCAVASTTDAYYVKQAKQLLRKGAFVLFVNWNHLYELDPKVVSFQPVDLADAIRTRFLSVHASLVAAVTSLMSQFESSVVRNTQETYDVAFHGLPDQHQLSTLRSEHIGRLVSIEGVIVNVGQLAPEMLQEALECKGCGQMVCRKATEPRCEPRMLCASCKKYVGWSLRTESPLTRWRDSQRLVLRPTNSTHVLSVITRGSGCACGDRVLLTGCVVAEAHSGPCRTDSGCASRTIDAHRSCVTSASHPRTRCDAVEDGVAGFRLVVLAHDIQKRSLHTASESLADSANGASEFRRNCSSAAYSTLSSLQARKADIQIDELAKAVAPSVFGHSEIKKGILLMLVGGMPKKLAGGSSCRGIIHVCLRGDTATAKSALLKWVAHFVPGALYASGAGSSAAGLTAAMATGDSGAKVLQPGALMMASGSVCCIDDLDMLQEKDQVAIREAMDQQSLTFSKAGMHSQLKADTSVFAACSSGDSVHARSGLQTRKRALQNVSSPLLPCFDLCFDVSAGECHGATDDDVARHIVSLACFDGSTAGSSGRRGRDSDISSQELLRHVQHARTIRPEITPEAQGRMRNCYSEMRQSMASRKGGASPRHLESLIRLSEAWARLHFDAYVRAEHVDAVFRLLLASFPAGDVDASGKFRRCGPGGVKSSTRACSKSLR
eukprot:TRINITY_DN30469_c0_g1_i1.p1 TRINITY_DN30469_c0_g1~~TRINITY_DN30469_c0_g1_i1.p1  ORF type:complete len:707 (-),score=67.36 TRINITY_DN30469_c0_g1_i1:32-2122(-)